MASAGSFKWKWKFHAFTTQLIIDSERNGSKADNRSWSLIRKVVHWQQLLSAVARRFRQAPHWIRCLPRQPLSPFQTCPASSKAQLSSLWWHQLWCWNTDALLRALTDELAVAVKGITAPNPSFCPSAKGFSLHRNVPRRTYSECNLSHHVELTYKKVATFSPIEKRKEKMCHRIMEMVVGSPKTYSEAAKASPELQGWSPVHYTMWIHVCSLTDEWTSWERTSC